MDGVQVGIVQVQTSLDLSVLFAVQPLAALQSLKGG
jgi:hypothetical protein